MAGWDGWMARMAGWLAGWDDWQEWLAGMARMGGWPVGMGKDEMAGKDVEFYEYPHIRYSDFRLIIWTIHYIT